MFNLGIEAARISLSSLTVRVMFVLVFTFVLLQGESKAEMLYVLQSFLWFTLFVRYLIVNVTLSSLL